MGARERGQVLPLVALAVVVAGGAVVLLGRLGAAAVDRARARTAADAAALAGAAAGPGEARQVAGMNRASVVRFAREGSTTKVRVRVGQAEATAWAVSSQRNPERSPTGHRPVSPG